MKTTPGLLALSLIFLLISTPCFGIPKTMPKDFYIHYKSVGGMISNHLDVVIKVGESSAKSRKTVDAEVVKYTFNVTREQLEPLYNALRSMNAFKLKSKHDEGLHRGGEYIAYLIAGKEYLVSNEGSFYIVKSHMNHFDESVDLITAFADRYRP